MSYPGYDDHSHGGKTADEWQERKGMKGSTILALILAGLTLYVALLVAIVVFVPNDERRECRAEITLEYLYAGRTAVDAERIARLACR